MSIPASAQAKIGYSTLDFGIFGGGQFPALSRGIFPALINYADGAVFGIRFTQDMLPHFGVEETFDMGRSNLRATIYNDPQVNIYGIAGRQYNIALNGLVYFTKREARWRPFLTVGPGVTWYKGQNNAIVVPGGPQQNLDMKYGPALVYGAGLKFNGWRRVGLRVDVRDTYTKSPHYGLPTYPISNGAAFLAAGGTEHFLTATLGLTFHLRVHDEVVPPPPPAPAPPPPPAPAPAPKVEISIGSISGAHDVCPGESLTLNSSASVANGSPSYQWMMNGSAAPGGTGSSFSVPTTSSGTESISLRVTAGGESATTSAVSVRVKNYSKPTVHISVAQSTISAGATDAVSAVATGSECGDPVNITYSASEGTMNGTTYDSSSVVFDQSAGRLQTKTIHITATATDRTGATATDTADVTVTSKPVARRLGEILFSRKTARESTPALSACCSKCSPRFSAMTRTPKSS